MTDLVVRAMTEPEFDAWRAAVVHAYADEQVEAGNWVAAEALEKSQQDSDALLPDGYGTADMIFLRGERPDGTPIGALWICLSHPRGIPDCGYLYDIEVLAAHRGAGYGRALLTAAEDALRSRGVGGMGLNVFGDNARARRLYESAGYQVTTLQMRKSFAG